MDTPSPFLAFAASLLFNDANDDTTRIVSRDETPCGVTVSTVFAWDVEQFETAIIDAHSVCPVERYETIEEAREGHARWLDFCQDCDGQVVQKLPWFMIDSEDYEIRARGPGQEP